MYQAKDLELDLVHKMNMQTIAETVIKKYKLLKFRMKIGYIAFSNNQTVKELMVRQILESYKILNKKGLVQNPYPRIDKTFLQ